MKKTLMPAICLAAHFAARPVAVIGALHNDVDLEKVLKDVSQQLEKIDGETKKTAENALSEVKKFGEVTNETKQTADKLLTQQTETSKVVQSLKDAVEALDGKASDIAQKVAEASQGGGGAPVMSLGAAVVAQDEKLKAYLGNSASGSITLKVANAITSAATSGGGLTWDERERTPIALARRRLKIRDLLNTAKTGTNLVTFSRQTLRDNQAGMVAEEAASAASSYGWTKDEASVKKISHHTNVTEETLADADQLQSELDGEMRYGLDLKEEAQLLAGDGTGENLEGLMTVAPAFSAAAGLPNENRIDRLRLAILQVVLENYVPTSIVLNPTDWAAIELLKVSGTDDRYVFGNPASGNSHVLWGKDVVDTTAMGVGEWLTGDLFMAATLYDRQDTEVLISSEHGTNFVEGMLTMKATKRLALAQKRLLAMVQGNFTFA